VTESRDRSLLLLLTGAFAIWLEVSGTALNFVRPTMRPYVLVAGVVAIVLALAPPGGLLSRNPASSEEHEHDHAHGGIGVGWLLVAPLLIALLVPPAPLGANAVRARRVSRDTSQEEGFPPVGAPVDGAVPMSMAEFYTRALRDPKPQLRGVRVRVVGFVSERGAASYRLGRFVIFCCAADAEALEVSVSGDAVPHRVNDWLEVTGTWVEGPGEVPRLRADEVKPVRRPAEPYEYTVIWSG
jgi:uncharacterized repeat protein (TIGR03943 family)